MALSFLLIVCLASVINAKPAGFLQRPANASDTSARVLGAQWIRSTPSTEKLYWMDDGCQSDQSDKPHRKDDVFGRYELSAVPAAGVRCCSQNGSTCSSPNSCPQQLPFDQAKAVCTALGQRLCTKDELLTDMCCGTGGSCDHYAVWTSTRADPPACNQSNDERLVQPCICIMPDVYTQWEVETPQQTPCAEGSYCWTGGFCNAASTEASYQWTRAGVKFLQDMGMWEQNGNPEAGSALVNDWTHMSAGGKAEWLHNALKHGVIVSIYFQGPRGSVCPAGALISTKKECEDAHDMLGLPRTTVWHGSSVDIPVGCSSRLHPTPGQPSNMHYNTAATGAGRDDLSPVCKHRV